MSFTAADQFLSATQRVFLFGYRYCVSDALGKSLPTDKAARRCTTLVRERITELEQQSQATVYSDAVDKFTPESLAILVYATKGRKRIRFWGNWMPDAYDPKPFPNGKLCDMSSNLKPVKGGFIIDLSDDVVFGITDDLAPGKWIP